MTRRPLGMLLAGLVLSTLGCTSVAPPSPSASATPGGDYPLPTISLSTAESTGPRDRPPVPGAPDLPGAYTFISAPDFLNQDVADLTAGGREQFTVRSTGVVANSTNAAYETALDHVITEMGSHGSDDVLVAGDLVEGRWGRDDSRTGVFGPVHTQAQRLRAWRRAADVYYSAWRERFAEHDLTTYTAVGDHELGDDPWRNGVDRWTDFKRRHVPEVKRLYAEQLLTDAAGRPRFADRPRGQARDTAYAVRLDEDVLLVTIDVFERRGGDLHMSVDPAQLRWLRSVLRQARREEVPWVMVQGHVPFTRNVRSRGSTVLSYEDGWDSDLWRVMVEGGVDVYLSGEVHDQTVHLRDGVLHVSHGSLFYRGEASYVIGQATADRLVLENRQFRGTVRFEDRLWTTSRQGAPGHISYPRPSIVTGTLVARRTRSGGLAVVDAEGVLAPRP
ncbi:MAG TPA: metallophosphoesterase [Nocardioides sp.]|nr:metallophosphoesterase [Nocardioides sp.]